MAVIHCKYQTKLSNLYLLLNYQIPYLVNFSKIFINTLKINFLFQIFLRIFHITSN